MKVIDSETGVAATYYNPPGTAFQPVQDQETFAVCPLGANLYGESRYLLGDEEMEALRGGMDLAAAADSAGPGFELALPFQVAQAQDGGGSCVPDERTLCLEDGRYAVRATWEKPDGETGDAVAWPLTGDTGLYWFFAPTNVEMVLKVLDGCGINQHRWVFAAGLTDVGVTMTVTDTETGVEKPLREPRRHRVPAGAGPGRRSPARRRRPTCRCVALSGAPALRPTCRCAGLLADFCLAVTPPHGHTDLHSSIYLGVIYWDV